MSTKLGQATRADQPLRTEPGSPTDGEVRRAARARHCSAAGNWRMQTAIAYPLRGFGSARHRRIERSHLRSQGALCMPNLAASSLRGGSCHPGETASFVCGGLGTAPIGPSDTGVTRTVIQSSLEPSSSSPTPERAPAPVVDVGGGINCGIVADVFDVLPEPVRDHPSVVPSAIARRVRTLDQRGWPRPQVRERLAGIETADKPGAAALTRLDNLAALAPPRPRPARPQWCGQCDERTWLRESAHDDRLYRCPDCHPRTTPKSANPAERPCATGSASVHRP